MNTNYYKEWITDKELICSYEGHSDPLIRRFVRIIVENGFFEVPVESPASTLVEYIENLKVKITDLEVDLEVVQADLSAATEKADRLSIRTVPQLLADLSNMVKEEQKKNDQLRKEATEAKRREEEALHKMNMWAILNK